MISNANIQQKTQESISVTYLSNPPRIETRPIIAAIDEHVINLIEAERAAQGRDPLFSSWEEIGPIQQDHPSLRSRAAAFLLRSVNREQPL